MPRSVAMVSWTVQCARSVAETTQRAEQVALMGGRMGAPSWTPGRYDPFGRPGLPGPLPAG